MINHALPFGVLEIDKKGIIRSYNPVEGINPKLVTGNGIFELIPCEGFDYEEFTKGEQLTKTLKLSESAWVIFLWLPKGALVIVRNTAPVEAADRIVEEFGEIKISIYQGRLIIT